MLFRSDDPQRAVTDTFVVRRFRTITQGRVARYFDFYFNVDFANSAVNIRDAYFDTRFSDAFRVRVGKAKVPFSYDRLILVANISFVERGLTTTVAPDRDTGVQVFGDIAGGTLSYAAALTNGVVDGGSSDTDSNENKDVTGRLLLRPWLRKPGLLSGLGVAAAINTGLQGTALPSFLTSGRQTFFSYSGTTADGRRTRWSPQAFYYHGPLGAYAEYVHSRGGVVKGTTHADLGHEAWQVAATWVLTGEAAGERNVRPKVNFDPPSRHFGAWQVAARYHELTVSRDAVRLGFAAPGASARAQAYTLGLNWYLNPFVKWNFNFERTVFDKNVSGARRPENAILLRAHLGL